VPDAVILDTDSSYRKKCNSFFDLYAGGASIQSVFGALGGSILPNLLGQSKQRTGSYSTGFLIYAGIAMFVFLLMQSFARIWTKKWVTKGGRAHAAAAIQEGIAAD